MVINKYFKKIFILAFIFSFMNTYTSYANIKESIKFNSITIEDGLSQSTVETMYQDSKGYIWIGTSENGANIINGENINHLNTKNSKIISDSIHDITGFDNSVFIGTNEGLSVVEKIWIITTL